MTPATATSPATPATAEYRAWYASCRRAARSALRPEGFRFTNWAFNEACRRSYPATPAEWCAAADLIAESVAAALGDELPPDILRDRIRRLIYVEE